MRIRNGEKGKLRQAHADVQGGKLVIYTAGAKQELVFGSAREVMDLATKLLGTVPVDNVRQSKKLRSFAQVIALDEALEESTGEKSFLSKWEAVIKQLKI